MLASLSKMLSEEDFPEWEYTCTECIPTPTLRSGIALEILAPFAKFPSMPPICHQYAISEILQQSYYIETYQYQSSLNFPTTLLAYRKYFQDLSREYRGVETSVSIVTLRSHGHLPIVVSTRCSRRCKVPESGSRHCPKTVVERLILCRLIFRLFLVFTILKRYLVRSIELSSHCHSKFLFSTIRVTSGRSADSMVWRVGKAFGFLSAFERACVWLNVVNYDPRSTFLQRTRDAWT